MSLEHDPMGNTPPASAGIGHNSPPAPVGDRDYWNRLIDEEAAAGFIDLSQRTLQGYRYRGNGPLFVRISARCIKYRRCDLRAWCDAKLRSSTSDRGSATA